MNTVRRYHFGLDVSESSQDEANTQCLILISDINFSLDIISWDIRSPYSKISSYFSLLQWDIIVSKESIAPDSIPLFSRGVNSPEKLFLGKRKGQTIKKKRFES
jgi:hypothetical protein